jgi:hypothetical protein
MKMEKDVGGTMWDALISGFTAEERRELTDSVTVSRRAQLDAAIAARREPEGRRRAGRPKGEPNA